MTDELKAEREAFESALKGLGWTNLTHDDEDGQYESWVLELAWEMWKARAKLECIRQMVPQDATQRMCDSVRSLLIAMEQSGRTFGSVRQTCRFAGMDVDNWPHWTINRDTEHFNKSACAALIWWLMRRSAHTTGGYGDD